MKTMDQQNEAQARANALMEKLKALGGVVVVVCMLPFLYDLGRGYLDHRKWEVEGSPAEPKFCAEWLHYYENFCTVYPKHCEEGPRKKARCDQGWDKMARK